MVRIRVSRTASFRLDEIWHYIRNTSGEPQAERYIHALFESFEKIETRGVLSRPIPAAFRVEGFFFRCQKHVIYWKLLSTGEIGIVTILHERMHQQKRLLEDVPDGTGPV